MRILGIDPGFAITGYSIIDYQGNKFKLIDSGAVTTKAGESFPLRLTKIYDDLSMIIDEYKPDAISVEELFFNNNVKTAINVAQARGVVLVVGCQKQIPTYEYTPLQIKQAVEKIFGVKVLRVNTINVKPKYKRVGRYAGTTSRYKKAIVTLAEGSQIEL